MDMADRVLYSDGPLGILEFLRVPFFPGGRLDIRHDDEADDIVFDNDAITLCLVCFYFDLVDGVDELAAEIELCCAKGLVFVAGIKGSGAFHSVENRL